MDSTLIAAFGLMLILEGVLPLVSPSTWRATFQRMLSFNDGQLRFVGLLSMLAGLALIMLV